MTEPLLKMLVAGAGHEHLMNPVLEAPASVSLKHETCCLEHTAPPGCGNDFRLLIPRASQIEESVLMKLLTLCRQQEKSTF